MSTFQYVQTVNINLGTLAMGLLVGVVGPTLMDLREVYNTSTMAVTYFLTSRSVGLLLGSIAGGKIFAAVNGQLVMALAMLAMGLSTMLLPLCPNLATAHVVSAVGGAGIAIFEIGACVWLVRLWEEKSSQHLQVYQLSFGLGAVIAPLIAEPFLSQHHSTINEESVGANFTLQTVSKSQVQVPYIMIGCFLMAVVISALISYWLNPTDIVAVEQQSCQTAASSTEQTTGETRIQLWLIFLLGVYILFDVAVESCFAGMIATFAVYSGLHFSKSAASYLTAGFWTAFTLGRVVAIPCSLCVSLSKMLVSSHAVLIASAAALLVAGDFSAPCLWVATIGLGLGMSALYGSSIAWTVQYVKLQHNHMGFLMITSCFGTMSPAFLLGSTVESDPMSLMRWTLALVVAFSTTLGLMLFSVRRVSKLANLGEKTASFEKVSQTEWST